MTLRPAIVAAIASVALLAGCPKKIAPIHPEALHHNDECGESLKAGDLEAAQAHCEQALEYSPDYADALVNLGMVALRSDQGSVARQLFTKALALREGIAEALHAMGLLELEDHNFAAAEKQLRRALDASPDHISARYNLAVAYYLMRKDEKAREHLGWLMKKHPDLTDPVHFDAVIQLNAGRVDAATAQLVHCVTQRPEVPAYWHALGVAFSRARRYHEAEDALRACLELSPADSECDGDLKALQRREPLAAPPVEAPRL
jgi:Flp pilus assembly protein TadD